MKRSDRAELSHRVERRLDALCAAFETPDRTRGQLARLLLALADDAAPTTIHRPAESVDVHIADSLAALEIDAVRVAATIADLGAGAGLPGLVLAAALPDTALHLIESSGRKAAFIERTAERMALRNVRVVAERAEDWMDGVGGCDVVCARALASLAVVVEYAAPLLRIGGTLVAWKGLVDADQAADGAAAAAHLGLEQRGIRSVTPFAGSRHRTLHVYDKVMETPPGYPRRAGIAAKRPLTAKKQQQSERAPT